MRAPVVRGRRLSLKNLARNQSLVATRTCIKRLVSKEGEFQVSLQQIGKLEKLRKYISDGFTTFIDMQWRWAMLVFVLGFLVTWLTFAMFYYAFGHVNGDITGSDHSDEHKPCVSHVYSFPTSLLFSVESQHTIGYGFRAVTDQCPHIIAAVFLQFILGVGVQCVIAGLVFAKLQRSKKRAGTIMFSSKACISKYNGKMCLMVRVGNLRTSLLIRVQAMGMLVKKQLTDEGDEIPLSQVYIDFFSESGSEMLDLLWPAILYHPIEDHSPLWNVTEREILSGFRELIIVLEGVIDSTGKSFQARTSYLPDEIVYGYRFKPISPTERGDGYYQLSYFDFNVVVPGGLRRARAADVKEQASQTISSFLSVTIDTDEDGVEERCDSSEEREINSLESGKNSLSDSEVTPPSSDEGDRHHRRRLDSGMGVDAVEQKTSISRYERKVSRCGSRHRSGSYPDDVCVLEEEEQEEGEYQTATASSPNTVSFNTPSPNTVSFNTSSPTTVSFVNASSPNSVSFTNTPTTETQF